ncbi:FAD-dependent oxidoreductase [Clostridium sp. LIBA-8841]|uniref:FAD-dependent oxidoreductase n=1 Tax=Clostridium sp. LIBA-8841 TaxID=2987530 RepID=UPI002AC5ACB1|nr:FAD-dependent oxidoreductase [Clostridium sp. LIBA-8841]MDZ5254096.1 FAD-dependent oxidoreductase [Clostridium sp. LIBA-8841]
MGKKIVIVGGVAGGASTAARLRRLDENSEIIMFERGPHVSFSNCCLPYHLSGKVANHEDLVLMIPEKFYSQYRIDARIYTEVTSINRKAKEVTVRNVVSGKEYTESYDKLVLSPGAKAIVPPIKGVENVNIFTVRNVVDIAKLNSFIKDSSSKNISVIGGGFIGVEVAENLSEAGYNVTLIEAMDQIMKPFDYDMVQVLHKEIYDKGINLIVGDKVSSFEKDTVVLESGEKITSDAVVMAIGVTPETDLAREAGLEIGTTGAIKVNQNYLTNDMDIYAVGDAVEVYNALTNSITKLPLAGPAQKQARAVADHIHGRSSRNSGYIGSSCIKVFDYNGASTGLTESQIKALNLNLNYEVVRVIPQDKVGLMPGSEPLHFKLIFEVPTGRILGAQSIGKGNADKRIDIIATLIKMGGTVEDLKDLELCYAPPFGTAKDVVNHAALVASNLLEGAFKQVYVHEVRDLVENGAYIIDVREVDEYKVGHIKGAKNIPLSEIRDRLDEIPTDIPVYLHCRSAQRSYNACLALQHLGFNNIYNVSGGFMGISFYEYYNDKVNDREPIVTEYNFN